MGAERTVGWRCAGIRRVILFPSSLVVEIGANCDSVAVVEYAYAYFADWNRAAREASERNAAG